MKLRHIYSCALLCLLLLVPAAPASDTKPEVVRGMEKISFLIGNWSVSTQEINPQNGTWKEAKITTTTFEPILDGSMIFERAENQLSGQTWKFNSMYSYDYRRDLYRVAIGDSVNGYLDIYEGHFEENTLSFDNRETGTHFIEENGNHLYFQLIWNRASKDEIHLRVNIALKDGGQWLPYIKSVYTRIKE